MTAENFHQVVRPLPEDLLEDWRDDTDFVNPNIQRGRHSRGCEHARRFFWYDNKDEGVRGAPPVRVVTEKS